MKNLMLNKTMLKNSLDYTVCSTDCEHYNRINCNLTAPITRYASMTVTCLTANCDIVVLNEDDYITINGKRYSLKIDYCNLNVETLAALLNNLFKQNELTLEVRIDESQRFIISDSKSFVLNSMTYNYTLITGFYNTSFPVYADYKDETDVYFIKANSVGFNLSTPVLYLLSNVGSISYRNVNESELSGSKIVMRINNSFSANYPIIVNNSEFETTLLSNDLSCLELTLVDAYMKEIKLLSPMYLSINVKAIPDEEIIPLIDEIQQK